MNFWSLNLGFTGWESFVVVLPENFIMIDHFHCTKEYSLNWCYSLFLTIFCSSSCDADDEDLKEKSFFCKKKKKKKNTEVALTNIQKLFFFSIYTHKHILFSMVYRWNREYYLDNLIWIGMNTYVIPLNTLWFVFDWWLCLSLSNWSVPPASNFISQSSFPSTVAKSSFLPPTKNCPLCTSPPHSF